MHGSASSSYQFGSRAGARARQHSGYPIAGRVRGRTSRANRSQVDGITHFQGGESGSSSDTSGSVDVKRLLSPDSSSSSPSTAGDSEPDLGSEAARGSLRPVAEIERPLLTSANQAEEEGDEICPICRHVHNGFARPSMKRREFLKKKVSTVLRMPDSEEKVYRLRSFLTGQGGVYGCKLLSGQLSADQLSAIMREPSDDGDHRYGAYASSGVRESDRPASSSTSADAVSFQPGLLDRSGGSGGQTYRISL